MNRPRGKNCAAAQSSAFHLLLCAIIFLFCSRSPAHGQATYQLLKSFGSSLLSTGASPPPGVIAGSDGALYGVTYLGGSNNLGVVYRLSTNGTYTVLHNFAGQDGSYPQAGLLEASNGLLFGTTTGGGSNGYGVVFKMAKDGSSYAVLHSFLLSDGTQPLGALIQAREDGALYGTTSDGGANGVGTVFRINTDGTGFTNLHDFADMSGSQPKAALIEGIDGALYGTTVSGGTNGNGTVFTLARDGSSYSVLHHFSGTAGDGANPYSPLCQGLDGKLYGTTANGGADNGGFGNGTIFSLSGNGTNYSVVYAFSPSGLDGANSRAGLVQDTNGVLFGVCSQGGTGSFGTGFKVNSDGTGFVVLHNFASGSGDGGSPQGLVLGTDQVLYGTASEGGSDDYGTAFALSSTGPSLSLLHSFVNPTGGDGVHPKAGLVAGSDGTLYGTTTDGGSNNNGTVFKIDPAGTNYLILRSLSGLDGAHPAASLIIGSDGMIYGTTAGGGSNSQGIAFRLDVAGSNYSVLHNFGSSNDGAQPQAPLVEGTDGALYGTTTFGGSNFLGTAFRLNKDGSGYSQLHVFSNASQDGNYPRAGLVQGFDGDFYGTTFGGGSNGYGTVFKLSADGAAFSVLHHFGAAGADGINPRANLVQGPDGTLYGTTAGGGTNGVGTVFGLSTNGASYAILYAFTRLGVDGNNPQAELVLDNAGKLYGSTYAGGINGLGTFFRLNTNGTSYAVLYSFGSSGDGSSPQGILCQGSNGWFYGSTSGGGGMRFGALFKVLPTSGGTTNIGVQYGRNGALVTFFSGSPGQVYLVQATADLTLTSGWQNLGYSAADADGIVQFLDTAAVSYSARFYRLVLP